MTSPIQPLRSDLTAGGFTVDGVGGLWGEDAAAALFRGHRVPAVRALELRRNADGLLDAAGTLARLFVLGMAVSVEELERALPSLGCDGAVELGLVAVDDPGRVVTPLLDLRPYAFTDARGGGEWWIASDLGELALGHAIGEAHVLGVGGASLTLAGLIISEPVHSALDLGTGCGIQAMHVSRHAQRVVATDISERALELARLNAALNGIENIEFRLGSLFEPVAGERFDQIVSNPPFVITPRGDGVPAYEYRDGGLVGDALVAEVIRGAAAHLNPGGVAQMLGNWEYHGETDAFDRITRWLDEPWLGETETDGTGLDAWIVEREMQDPALYAETWIRDGGIRAGTVEFDRLSGAWLDDFEQRQVTRVGFGYVTLRRPPAGEPTLRRLERLDGALSSTETGLGSHLAATLAAHDWQHDRTDDELARTALTVAGDVTEERHYWPGDDDPTVMTLRQGGGFGRSAPLDTGLAALVGASDGELSVAAITAALAELLDVDEAALRAQLLPRIRELIVTGFLLPPLSPGRPQD